MFCKRGQGPQVESDGDNGLATLREWIACRLREDLRDPVRVDPRHRGRVMFVLGVEVRINRRRRTIMARGRCGPDSRGWVHGHLKLDRPFSGRHFAQAWWWCVREELPLHLREIGDARLADELPQWINHAARRSGRLPAARRQLIEQLHLNPRLLARARALRHDGIVSSRDYVSVWQHPHASKQRIRESPRLWPLYNVLGCSPEHDLHFVMRELRHYGLTRGGWKALCRHGRALWWPIRRCHEFGCNARREIIELANLVAAIGPDLPPPALTLALGRLASLNPFLAADTRRLLLPFRAAWRHYDALPPSERTMFARGPVDAVLSEWLLRPGHPKVPRGADWRWFEEWATKTVRASEDKHVRWPGFGGRRRIDGVEVVPLRNLHAVREAGFALRNCMGRAGRQERNRDVALFLMRDASGRAQAMFSADLDRRSTEPREIRGHCNREVDAALRRIACVFLRAYRRGCDGSNQARGICSGAVPVRDGAGLP
jgi:hypothetical protein